MNRYTNYDKKVGMKGRMEVMLSQYLLIEVFFPQECPVKYKEGSAAFKKKN